MNKFIWQALGCPGLPEFKKYTAEQICACCGERNGAIRKEDVFGSSFTNWDRMRRPESNAVCSFCYTVLRTSDLRRKSWLITPGEIQYFKRVTAANVLFAEKKTPFMLYITTSYKKLGQLKVKLNTDPDKFILQYEETPVEFEPTKIRPLWEILQLFYSMPAEEEDKKQPKSFFTKAEMRTGNYQFHRIKDFGLQEWREKETVIAEYRGTAVLDLLLYVLNQEKFSRSKGEQGENRAKVRVGEGPGLSNMACDRLGQYLLFQTDEDI